MDEIPYSQRVKVTSIHLDREAIAWHRSYMKARNTAVDPIWTKYILALNERFGDGYEDSMESIKHLEQTSNVRAYQAEFDRLLTGVNLSNENVISCFLGGLKPELNKSGNANGRKLLTAVEMDEKRAKGLCFLCDEKYVRGHECKAKKQLFLVELCEEGDVTMAEDLELDQFQDQEAIDNIANPEECMTISLQAFTGVTGYQTIRVTGYHEKRPLQILIDTGSTHNFIDEVMARQLGCKASTIIKRTIEFMHQGKKHVLRGATTQVKTTKAKVLNKKPA
ncbi:hypothetical protein KY290_031118 [Solanum tuberosum]|uniref:Retrotransposon gag domain-containing protein n=1 Tax=Solanum tuberosum TaxID=4113 RepID=A0ABQ7U892_SOLTU|nr:hypothetical protein KY290_031118 [Solanum tuberosum]